MQATLPDDPEAVLGERHPQMVACETFLGHPIRKFDGVKAESAIAPRSPWARAWLSHVESLEGIGEHLHPGESYVLDGLVWHLEVERGVMYGVVLGSQLYAQKLSVAPLSREDEAALIEVGRDRVADAAHMLTGRLPREVFSAFTDPETGLFPGAEDLSWRCSCPKGRSGALCKHVAALLLGFTERIERRARELFSLRGTDPEVLKGLLPPGMSAPPPPPEHLVPVEHLEEVFDLGLDASPVPSPAPVDEPAPDPLDLFLASGEPRPLAPPSADPEPEAIEAAPPPAPSGSSPRADASWLDEDWEDDDLDAKEDMDAEVFGGGGAPSPISLGSDAEGEEVLEIGRADLLELGLPSHRVQRWLSEGTLLRTKKRGRYQLTPEAWSEIEPLLDGS